MPIPIPAANPTAGIILDPGVGGEESWPASTAGLARLARRRPRGVAWQSRLGGGCDVLETLVCLGPFESLRGSGVLSVSLDWGGLMEMSYGAHGMPVRRLQVSPVSIPWGDEVGIVALTSHRHPCLTWAARAPPPIKQKGGVAVSATLTEEESQIYLLSLLSGIKFPNHSSLGIPILARHPDAVAVSELTLHGEDLISSHLLSPVSWYSECC
ncbi:uncharacterized protein KD926_010602 [Aspergillus affinis]|uniref:uncharacterized protein n=1 Tax=Aspergillus affinis TaxID=1070780 RepID=UPI0022FE0893|nr:uncharacterized protein KD926_010602 [Aspergillus affinis]KAI9038658.1 hypothetical protein KD926_010602 [Aspergillus affinis]